MEALHNQTVVIVYAGQSVYNPTLRASFSQNAALLKLTGMRPVIVHGGLPRFQAQGQVPEAPVREAMRTTLAIHVARTALAEVNLELVRLIGVHGVKVLGINGQDGHCLTAGSTAGGDFISPIEAVDTAILEAFLTGGLLPVVMPLAPDADGDDRLVSPERLGNLLAQKLKATTLVMMVENSVLREFGDQTGLCGKSELEKWLAEHASNTAAAYAREALDALTHGVQSVHLVDISQPQGMVDELLTEEGRGIVFCGRSSAELVAETRRYFADADSVLRPDFSVERKRVVRF
ncbi:acetylglutamate kinase [Chitinimonas arctica]|uniref:Acetylglutamate kinase n=2 Tax=Chitinimonas arctica TaxID=2594795 RepID=A0A516SM51_9NEIS|nr:acetylglutamate kinase [Chitinimonas arctica]